MTPKETLMQDEDLRLSKALSRDPNARQLARDAAERNARPATHRCRACGCYWRQIGPTGTAWTILSTEENPGCSWCCENDPSGALEALEHKP